MRERRATGDKARDNKGGANGKRQKISGVRSLRSGGRNNLVELWDGKAGSAHGHREEQEMGWKKAGMRERRATGDQWGAGARSLRNRGRKNQWRKGVGRLGVVMSIERNGDGWEKEYDSGMGNNGGIRLYAY